MRIEDGRGKNGDASVSADQRLNANAKTAQRAMYASRDFGLAYQAVYDAITATAGDYVAYLKNDSATRNMFINDIHAGGVQGIKWKIFAVTGIAAAGESVTPTELNLSKSIPAEAIAMAGDTTITGLTAGAEIITFRSLAFDTKEFIFGGALILGPGDAIVVEYDTGTAGLCELGIDFHMEALDASS